MVRCFSNMCLCDFGAIFGQCISVFISCDFTVLVSIAVQFAYVLSYVVLLGPGSLWSILMSQFLLIPQIVLQPLSQKRWQLFQICLGVGSVIVVQWVWLQFLHQKQSNVVPVAYSRRKVHSECQRLCIRLFGSHQLRYAAIYREGTWCSLFPKSGAWVFLSLFLP